MGAALLSLDGRVRRVNDAFCAITAHPPEELVGSDLADLHAEDASRVRGLLGELAAGRSACSTFEAPRLHRSGSRVWVRSSVSLARDSAARPLHLLALCEEIGGEHSLLANSRRGPAELALDQAPLASMLGAFVRAAESQFAGPVGVSVFLVRPDQASLELGAAAGVPRAYTKAVEGAVVGPDSIWCAAAAQDGRVTVVGDVTEGRRWARYSELALQNGIRACCAFPIRSPEGTVLGTLALYRSRPWTPEAAELAAGEQLAANAALLIEAHAATARRERADEALREGEQRLAAVFQQAAGGIACVDESGRFVLVNDRYCEIVGRSREELNSLRVQEITHPDDLARHRQRLYAVARGGSPLSFEQRYLRPDRSFVWVSQDVSVIRDAAGRARGVIAICQDVHERKLAQGLLLEQRRLLELVAADRPLDECLTAFSRAASRFGSGVGACTLLAEPSGKTLDRCVAAKLPDSFPTDSLRGAPIDARLLAAHEGVSFENIGGDERWSPIWRELCAAHDVAACHVTPVPGPDDALLGLLVLGFRERRGPTAHERRLAEIGAHVASIAITRDRTARELEESRARLSAEFKLASDLHELGTRLLAAPDMPAAAQQVLDAVLAFVGAEMGTVQVHDPAAGGLRIMAQRGFDPAALAALPVIGPDYGSACATALGTNERVVVHDFASSVEFASHREVAASLGYRAELSTPLRTREGEIVGMLNVHFPRPHQPSARELRTIDLCVRPLAHLMERARAEAELRQHSEKFRVLVEGAPYGVCLFDAELRVRQLNPTARQVFGEDWDPVGKELREALCERLPLTGPAQIDAIVARFRRTLETGEPDSATEWPVPQSDGRTEWFDWRVQRIPLANETFGVVAYIVDVSSKVESRQAIAASEERFRSLVSVLTDVPWTADAAGAFVTPQPAWSAFTGRPWEEVRGHGWLQSIHPEDRVAIWSVCATGPPHEVSGRLWHAPTQEYREFVARTVPLRNPDGSVREWVGSCTDVTEHRRTERALREANRRKDEFLAMLGHELRNPLASLRNAITLAGLDEARRASALEIASRQVSQLGRLIDDLLDVARITQGRITLRKEPSSVAELLERAAEESRPALDERGLRLLVAPPREALYVEVDPARIEQVLGNLLANAARYSERGRSVQLVAEREGNEAVIRVRDDGIGIAPDLLSVIFEPFAQADRGSRRSAGGLGIGLSVVRRLVELHGGRVAARSEGRGQGAEFVVRLPALAAPGPSMAPEAPARAVDPPRTRVLVIEDDRDAAASMRMLLEYLGHSVEVAHDGATALERANAAALELIFVDIGLPDMDGYEVARRIRREPALRSVRLVALTGYAGEEDRQRARAAGFDRHLAKPVAVDTLRELFEQLGVEAARVTPG